MKRSALIITGFIFLIAVSMAFISADEPTYKNLKVLKKDISKPELDSIMHFFAMSLGEKCGFCHYRKEGDKMPDFASDANPNKDVARYMMRMTIKINKKYFTDKEHKDEEMIPSVTCYTCHHGEGHPAVKPPPMRRDSMGPPPGNMGNFPRDSMKNSAKDSVKSWPADSTKAPQQ